MWLFIKRPVNVWHDLQAALLLSVWLCWWLCDWNGLGCLNWFASCWLIVFDGDGAEILVYYVEFYGFCDELPLILTFSNFMRRFLLAYCSCYRPLVSGFTGCLKLIAIKNPCKTGVLWICWNYLWDRCWRLVGKCVIFGFFAADTATKQPKWLLRKCRSTAL